MNAKKLKVMFISQTSRFGGAERVLYEYLVNLDTNVIDPLVIAPSGELTDNLKNRNINCIDINEFEQLGSTRKRIKVGDIFKGSMLIRRVNSVIRSTDPDVIFTNSVKSHILVNLVKRKKPTVIRLHDFPSSFGKFSKALLKYSINNADELSCVSKSVADDFQAISKTNRSNVSVSYNGFTYSTDNQKVKHYRKRVVVAAWLLKWKGFNEFIEGMELIADKVDWDFVIAGDVAEEALGSYEYKKEMLNKIANSPYSSRFIVHGRFNNLNEIACCPQHCIFVQPSIKPDPLPTVIFEAAKLKLPVVTSSLGGSKEIIIDSVSGYLISPTPSYIAENVLKLIENYELREEFGENLKSRCFENFTTDEYVVGLTKTILNSVGGK